MASRKQRRRRQKERRHEYEYVYVDEEGQEVDVDPDELESARPRSSRRNGKPSEGKASSRKGGRPTRKVDPPSWSRVIRRALILAPAIFFALTLLQKKQSVAGHLALTAFYTAFFIPFMYLLDRSMYRTYLKRTGQAPPPAAAGRR